MYSNESIEVSEERNVARGVLIGAVVSVLLWALVFIVISAAVAHADRPITRPEMRPCLSDEGESAFPCVWMASVMGNHKGHSFRIYRDGRVKLISDDRAFALLGDCDLDGPLYCKARS